MASRRDPKYAASLPVPALSTLADLRREEELLVILAEGRAWLLWGDEDSSLLHRLMSIPNVSLFESRDGLWYGRGRRLPEFKLPLDSADCRSLLSVIVPDSIEPASPCEVPSLPTTLALIRDVRPRPATTLLCPLAELSRWADLAPTAEIEALSAATDGDRVIVRGRKLPAILAGERFWGGRLIVPLGFRPDPDLPEASILEALQVGDEDVLILGLDYCEAIPIDAFMPLSRAAVRMAIEEGPE